MTEQLPSWPNTAPACGSVVLREFTDEDVHLAVELGDDPYIPLIGTLPALPPAQQALEWINRQRGRVPEGVDHLRMDSPHPAPCRAIHGTVEHQLDPRCETSGYQREGLLRSHQEIGGIRRDMLLYARTRP